jgi:hypothetical protein
VPDRPSIKNVGWRHDKTLGGRECKVMGSGLLGVGGRGYKMSFWTDFVFLQRKFDRIGLRFGENFEVNFGVACVKSMPGNVRKHIGLNYI